MNKNDILNNEKIKKAIREVLIHSLYNLMNPYTPTTMSDAVRRENMLKEYSGISGIGFVTPLLNRAVNCILDGIYHALESNLKNNDVTSVVIINSLIEFIKDDEYASGFDNINKYRECFLNSVEDLTGIKHEIKEIKESFCEWEYISGTIISDGYYKTGCTGLRPKESHNFNYCPYCRKKLKRKK